MWEWIQSWGSSAEDYTDYVYTSTGEVYDRFTGALVGWYDETTQTIIDGAGDVVETVSDVGVVVYEDLRSGVSATGDLIGAGIDVAGSAAGAADKALNLVSVVMIGGLALGAYLYFFGGKTAIMKGLK